jgi:hypothetical protein
VNSALSQSLSLSDLADRINAEHAEAGTALRAGLEHARNAGLLLLEAKAQCAHGHWVPWLESNVHFSVRAAQAYMRVAQRWNELEAKAQPVALLTFKDAVKLLAEPTRVEPEQPAGEEIEADNADWLASTLTKAGSPPDPSLIPRDGYCLVFSGEGELLWIEPSEHRSYYYVTYFLSGGEDAGGMVQGTKRPVLDIAVPSMLRDFGAERIARVGEREELLADERLSYNRWLYRDYDDYREQQRADWRREAERRKEMI